MAARKIGQILIDMGFITDEQRDALLEEQAHNPGHVLLGRIAEDMGLVSDDNVVQALSEQLNLPVVDLLIGHISSPFCYCQ